MFPPPCDVTIIWFTGGSKKLVHVLINFFFVYSADSTYSYFFAVWSWFLRSSVNLYIFLKFLKLSQYVLEVINCVYYWSMPKRSDVLLFYDKLHRRSINVILTISGIIGAVGFLRACDILFYPKPLPLPEEHEDYQKMREYKRQQKEQDPLST